MAESTVSIRELKSRLSHYLQRTRDGESVVITDRGVPIGRIVPIGQGVDEKIEALRSAGLLKWNGRKLPRRKPLLKTKGKKTISDLLIEDRG